jgi:formylglycine-generating enzyme required for sulfatase activity
MIAPAADTRYLHDLQQQIDSLFSLDEVKDLCQSLGFDYENLPADTRAALIRELMRRLLSQDRLQKLVDLVRVQRPAVPWADVPVGLALIAGDPFDEQQFRRLTFEPEMARVPAGPFLMGSDGHAPAEAPAHTVDLPTFAIGVYPVTNELYARYITDARRAVSPLLLWDGNRPPADRLRQPVTGVTWHDARNFCRWLTQLTGRPYTLPTEAQWEKAARGPDGRLFPWGNEWLPDRANTAEELVPVDAYPAQSVYGVRDLVGNAREWTLTAWGRDPRTPDPLYAYPWREDDDRNNPELPETTRRVFRGGRSAMAQADASPPLPGSPAPPLSTAAYRCTARGGFLPDKPGPSGNRHGFRVALSLPTGANR